MDCHGGLRRTCVEGVNISGKVNELSELTMRIDPSKIGISTSDGEPTYY